MQTLSREALSRVVEPAPGGPSVQALIAIAREFGVVATTGLIESDDDGRLFNCYVAVIPG